MKNKKILIISLWGISEESVGGTERYVIDIAEGLKSNGHFVDVVMLTGRSFVLNGVSYKSLNFFGNTTANEYDIRSYFNGKLSRKKLRLFADKIESMIGFRDYDVVQVNSLLFYYLLKDKKRIFTIHTNPYELRLDWGVGAYKFFSRLIRSGILESDFFIAPSNHYANVYKRDFGVNVAAIPHSIDPGRLKTSLAKEYILNKYNLENKYTILFPSRLDFNQKRPQVGLKSLIKIKNKLPDTQIVFTGLDNQYNKFAAKLKTIALKGDLRIEIVRFDNMAEAYKIADLVLLPSGSESFGYSALESITLKKKTILNNIPTFLEIYEGSQLASVFDWSSKDLGKKILEMSNLNNKVNNDEYLNWAKRYSKEKWISKFEEMI